MTHALFQEDAYLRECNAQVRHSSADGIVLDQTVFYPLGGGQPGDQGVLRWGDGEETPIMDTRKGENQEIIHFPLPTATLPPVGADVQVVLDWERRYRHMRMHTCLHLLGAVLTFPVTGGSIGAQKSRLDFDMVDPVDKATVTAALNALIVRDDPVETVWITEAELDAQPELVRTLSVKPPRGAGRIRLLKIADIDLQPCGGTHLKRTGEIGPATVSKVEKKGRQNRRVHVILDS